MSWWEWAIVMFIAGAVSTVMAIVSFAAYAFKHAEKFGPIVMHGIAKKAQNANNASRTAARADSTRG